MSESVVTGAIRSPLGRRSGAFREVRPDKVNTWGSAIAHEMATATIVERIQN